jgi:hypothetical protein
MLALYLPDDILSLEQITGRRIFQLPDSQGDGSAKRYFEQTAILPKSGLPADWR